MSKSEIKIAAIDAQIKSLKKSIAKHEKKIEDLKAMTPSNAYARWAVQRQITGYTKNIVMFQARIDTLEAKRGVVKEGSIQFEFQKLQENYSPDNISKYIDFLRTKPVEAVLEDAKLVFVEPTMGADFMLEAVQNLPTGNLSLMYSVYNDHLFPFFENAHKGNYENKEHLQKVTEAMNILKERIDTFDFKEDTVQLLQEQLESVDDELDILIFDFPEEPEEAVMEALVDFHPSAIGSNGGVALLRIGKRDKAEAIRSYIARAQKSLDHMEKKKKEYNKKSLLHKAGHDALWGGISGGVDLDNNIRALKAAINYQSKKLKELESKQKLVKESIEEPATENIGTVAPSVVYAEEAVSLLKKRTELSFSINFTKTFMDESEEINMESFNQMMRDAYFYDNILDEEETILTEGLNDAIKKRAISAGTSARKSTNKLRKKMADTRRMKTAVKKVPEHLDKLVDNTIGRIGKMDKEERRKRLIEGGFKFKLLKLIRNAILIGGGLYLSPALTAIGILAHLAFDHQLDRKVRHELLDELELELKVTKEKLKDADAKGEKKKKYQLMRIENALEKDIERIRFNLNRVGVSKRGVKI